MLNNEEKGILISFLDSVDSIFGNFDFNIKEAPWIVNRWKPSYDIELDFDYFVEALTRKFVDQFVNNGINLILNSGGILNEEKSQEVYEFISKNFVVLDKNISSLKDRISELVVGFRNSIFNAGTYKGKDEQTQYYKSKIPIIGAESKRNSDYYMLQAFSRLSWFDGQAYRKGQLKTHFTVRCSECGLDMHFYDEDLNHNSDLESIVSNALNYYIDKHCRDYDTGEIREDIEHEILLNFEDEPFDFSKNPVQSIFSYVLGLLHQHSSMVLKDGKKIHFDENDSGWVTIIEMLNNDLKTWHHTKCPEVPWSKKQDQY